jgi:hypothetical protein
MAAGLGVFKAGGSILDAGGRGSEVGILATAMGLLFLALAQFDLISFPMEGKSGAEGIPGKSA